MPRPPYTNFPFPFYRNHSSIPPNFQRAPRYNIDNYNNSFQTAQNENRHENENSRNFDKKNKSNKNTDDYLFDLFGLKIYSDDALLVSLIYFLYTEGVKDDGLFIVLVLLLLS